MAGRPKKPKGTTRDNILKVRLTNDERALLDKSAAHKGLETSSWARSVLLGEAEKVLEKPV